MVTTAGGRVSEAVRGVGVRMREWRDKLRRRRSWMPLAVVFALGIADLLLRGWCADGRLLLLAGVVLAALIAGRRAGWIALGTATAVLLVYGMRGAQAVNQPTVVETTAPVDGTRSVEITGQLMPTSASGTLPAALWPVGVAVFLVAGLVILWASSPAPAVSEEGAPPVDITGPVDGAGAPVAITGASKAEEAASLPVDRGQTSGEPTPQVSDPQLARRARYLAASLAVVRSFWGSSDRRMLLSLACEGILEQFGFDLVMVYLIEAGGQWVMLRDASSVAGKAAALRGLRLPLGGADPVGAVAAEGETRVVPVAERQRRSSPRHQASLVPLLASETQTTLLLPLWADNQPLGVLDLHSRDDAMRFSEDDVAALQQLADHLALALVRVQRVGNGDAAVDPGGQSYPSGMGLTTPVDITGTPVDITGKPVDIIGAQSERGVCEAMLRALDTAGKHHRYAGKHHRFADGRHQSAGGRHRGRPTQALVIQADSDRDVGGRDNALRVIAQMHESDLTYDAYDLIGADATTPFAVASCVDVVILGLALTGPLWIGDLANLDPSLSPELRSALVDLAKRLEMSQAGRLLGTDDEVDVCLPSALAFLPLRTRDGEAIGGLLALYDHVHSFSTAERQAHQMLTDLGGVALHQQQRYAEAVHRAERAAVLSSIRERLWRAEDVETILRTTAVELGRALDVDTVTVEATPGDRLADEDGLTL